MKKAYELNADLADVLSAYGDMLLFKGQYLNAMKIYREAMEKFPEDPQSYISMARLIIHVNQKEDEALGYLKRRWRSTRTTSRRTCRCCRFCSSRERRRAWRRSSRRQFGVRLEKAV